MLIVTSSGLIHEFFTSKSYPLGTSTGSVVQVGHGFTTRVHVMVPTLESR